MELMILIDRSKGLEEAVVASRDANTCWEYFIGVSLVGVTNRPRPAQRD